MNSGDDAGQVAPLMVLALVVTGLACLGLGRFGRGAVDAAGARTAADAAALGGAAGGEADARALARANGGQLVGFERAGADVRVRVRLGAAVVSARAQASGRVGSGGSSSGSAGPSVSAPRDQGGLDPGLQAALARAGQLLGTPVPITSGVRSALDQARLFTARSSNPYPVAPPGTSMHERGLAVDVPRDVAERLAPLAGRTGLCRPYPEADAVHFELCGRRLSAGGAG